MKTLIPIVFLLIFLCACNGSGVSPDATSSNDSISSEISAESSEVQIIVQSQTSEIDKINHDDAYHELLVKEDYILSFGLFEGNSSKYAFRLYSQSNNYDKIIIMSGYSSTLYSFALKSNLSSNIIEIDLNTQDKTTSIIIGAMHLFLDFNTEKYVQHFINELLKKDEYIISSWSKGYPENGLAFRLHSQPNNYDKMIVISDYDRFFDDVIALYPNDIVEIALDTEKKTATIVAEKNHYFLDFNNEKYTFEIKYRTKDLDPKRLYDKSSDGKFELYQTYLWGEGDAWWGEYVVVDTEKQDIWYLTDFINQTQAVFCGENAILINRINELELLDMYTGKPLQNTPDVEYGQAEYDANRPRYYTIGIAYDDEQKKTLVAYRDKRDLNYDYEPTYEIHIAVFNENGQKVNTIDTGFMIQPHVNIFHNLVTFDSVGNGTAILSTYADNGPITLGKIEY